MGEMAFLLALLLFALHFIQSAQINKLKKDHKKDIEELKKGLAKEKWKERKRDE